MAKKRTFKHVLAGLPAGVTSGSQLIRDQIAKGVDKPSAIKVAIKAETGVDVSTPLINSVKMALKKKSGSPAGAPKGKRAARVAKSAAPASNTPGADSKNMTAVESAILLTEQFGAAKARAIIDSLK